MRIRQQLSARDPPQTLPDCLLKIRPWRIERDIKLRPFAREIFAQFSLGLMIAQGEAVESNLVEAYVWFDLAVKQDHAEALKTRSVIGKRMTPAEINDAEERSGAWKPTPP